MIPNKSGWCRYYDKNGKVKLVELVGEHPEVLCVVLNRHPVLTCIKNFEENEYFDSWIDYAHPPVAEPKRYSLDQVYGNGGPTTEYEMVEDENGAWVRYEDIVK